MTAQDSPERSDDQSGSPLARDTESVASARPQSPRLGIIHLLGWMTCIAVYAAAQRLFWSESLDEASDSLWTVIGLYALGEGAALGGLIILAARRVRGLRFPVYPGEVLLVVLGLSTVYGLAAQPVFTMIDWPDYVELLWPLPNFPPHIWIYYALFALLYFLAGRRINLPRWRRYFYLEAAAHAFTILAPFAGIALWSTSLQLLQYVTAGVMIVVVIMDWRQRLPWPWTHWLGPAILLWALTASLTILFWQMIVGPFR